MFRHFMLLPPTVMNVQASWVCWAVTLIVMFLPSPWMFILCLVICLPILCLVWSSSQFCIYMPGVVWMCWVENKLKQLQNPSQTLRNVQILSAVVRYYSSTFMKSSIHHQQKSHMHTYLVMYNKVCSETQLLIPLNCWSDKVVVCGW